MNQIICPICEKLKDLSAFPLKGGGRRRNQCAECFNDKRRASYRDKPGIRAKYKSRMSKRNREFRIKLFEYLLSHPCVDCGESHPLKLEFDHIVKKEKNVTGMSSEPWSNALKEISRCEVRCGSCHLMVTQIRANTVKAQLAKSLGLL